jgi:hypothetical protein
MNDPKQQSVQSEAAFSGPPPKTVKFIFQRSGNFRVYPAEGCWGVFSQSGAFHIEFYTEHQPVPESVTYALNPDGTLPDQWKSIEGMSAPESAIVVRDVQAAVVLSLPAAMQLHALLDKFINIQMKLGSIQRISETQEG